MTKFFISPLFCLALVVALPLQLQAKQADEYKRNTESEKCGCKPKPPQNSNEHMYLDENLDEFAEFLARISVLDENQSSPIHRLSKQIENGDSVVLKDDVIQALAHAEAIIAEYNDQMSDDQIEHMSGMFNALIDVVAQYDANEQMRDCGNSWGDNGFSSPCDEDSALKIKKILVVLNKAIFCDVAVFRDRAIFLQNVAMDRGLDVRHRIRAHKIKTDELKAHDADIKRLEADKIKADRIRADEIEVCELTISCTETVECNLIVGCSIFMNDSLSPAVGNIYKNGIPFLQNFGVGNTFVGDNAGNFTLTGINNSGFGTNTLSSNTTGTNDTAIGFQSLHNNTTGNFNTASGVSALLSNTTGSFNTANGGQALDLNTTGGNNTALGAHSLQNNTTGNDNTALGSTALQNVTTGSANIAIGSGAGTNLTGAESNDIYIGNAGVLGESAAIRIGTVGTQTTNFQAGIFGVTTTNAASPVLVDSVNGQLGTISSSIRYKENVQDMNEASSAILQLRPVTFSYKADATHTQQFGLVAEEVNKVMPALVIRGADGQIETVKYHELASLLLNEVIKLNARVEALEAAAAA